MLLQTNSYIVPRDRRMEHARLLRRFRQTLMRLGCDHFEVYEQVGANWSTAESTGRFVQIMRFRDRRHQMAVQSAERSDPGAGGHSRVLRPHQFSISAAAGAFRGGFLRQLFEDGAAAVWGLGPRKPPRRQRRSVSRGWTRLRGGRGWEKGRRRNRYKPEQAGGAEIFGTTRAPVVPEERA